MTLLSTARAISGLLSPNTLSYVFTGKGFPPAASNFLNTSASESSLDNRENIQDDADKPFVSPLVIPSKLLLKQNGQTIGLSNQPTYKITTPAETYELIKSQLSAFQLLQYDETVEAIKRFNLLCTHICKNVKLESRNDTYILRNEIERLNVAFMLRLLYGRLSELETEAHFNNPDIKNFFDEYVKLYTEISKSPQIHADWKASKYSQSMLKYDNHGHPNLALTIEAFKKGIPDYEDYAPPYQTEEQIMEQRGIT